MRVEYDPESIELTEAILQGLMAAGYQGFVHQAYDGIAEAEEFVLKFLERAHRLLCRGNPLSAFDLLGDDVKARPMSPSWMLVIGIAESMTVGEFLSLARNLQQNDALGVNRNLRRILAQILPGVAPNHVYKPDVPFNAVEALNAAFHVLVAPRRCFEFASEVFQGLGRELEITDSRGARVYGAAELESTLEGEIGFWRLWDQADAIWGFQGLLAGVQEAQQASASEQDEAIDGTSQLPLIIAPETVRSLFDVKAHAAAKVQQMILARPEGLAA